VPGVLEPGEALEARRELETRRSAEILGVTRVEFLGYRDSGMMGEPTNEDPDSFWQADVEEAAARLAAILADVDADLLTIYDDHGLYGHPDHIQVHRVGRRAAELAGIAPEQLFANTMSREAVARVRAAAPPVEAGEEGAEAERVGPDMATFGTPEAALTHAVDVRSVIARKRSAMEAHRSQIAPDSFFLAMPEPVFEATFGTEWFFWFGAPRSPGAPFLAELLPSAVGGGPTAGREPAVGDRADAGDTA
jgi:LmbE family N-acetylglucosaminyl deacetylase